MEDWNAFLAESDYFSHIWPRHMYQHKRGNYYPTQSRTLSKKRTRLLLFMRTICFVTRQTVDCHKMTSNIYKAIRALQNFPIHLKERKMWRKYLISSNFWGKILNCLPSPLRICHFNCRQSGYVMEIILPETEISFYQKESSPWAHDSILKTKCCGWRSVHSKTKLLFSLLTFVQSRS